MFKTHYMSQHSISQLRFRRLKTAELSTLAGVRVDGSGRPVPELSRPEYTDRRERAATRHYHT